jgi:replicative DNA helicase
VQWLTKCPRDRPAKAQAATKRFTRNPDPRRLVDRVEVIVEKQRNGPTGSVFLSHDRQHFDVGNYGGEIPE